MLRNFFYYTISPFSPYNRMFKNYLKIAFRNLWRNKVYTTINVLGLSLGLTCAVLLYLYVQDELTYDRYFAQSDKIYRAINHFKSLNPKNSGIDITPFTSGLLAETMKKEFPEVEYATRMLFNEQQMLIEYQDIKIFENKTAVADTDFFQVFSFKLLVGNPKTCLKEPNVMVLTQSLAQKIFGNAHTALNKTLRINDQAYLVTGVMEDVPLNTHFTFNALGSFKTIAVNKEFTANWGNNSFYTYFILKNQAKIADLNRKLPIIAQKYTAKIYKEIQIDAQIETQAVVDIHLKSNHFGEIGKNGSLTYVYTFSVIAAFVLLIAAVNYMNLATAHSLGRAREVGIRKLVGSFRTQLMGQFLIESIVLSYISLIISLIFIELVLPNFNQLAGKNLQLNYLNEWWILPSLLIIGLVLGVFSGSYPAFFLSRFNPVEVLKGKFGNNKEGLFLRKSLVIIQFTISIALIIATWVIYEQVNFMRNQDLGFQKDQVILIGGNDSTFFRKSQILKTELLKNPQIQGVGITSIIPGIWMNNSTFIIKKNGQEETIGADNFGIDEHFIQAMGMKLVAGRNFDPKNQTESKKSVIINETFAREMGWKEPLGQKIGFDNDFATVVGVVKDFHFRSLYQKLNKTLMFYFPDNRQSLMVRISPQNAQKTADFVQKTFEEVEAKFPYSGYFLNQNFLKNYIDDEKRGQVFLIFAGLAIFIAGMGLFGLASFTIAQRTQEIGIRKVLGASVKGLLVLLTQDFLRLVLIAFVIASPLAYYLVGQWLQAFPYRIQISWTIFFYSGLTAFLIALFTIIYQAIRASLRNPIEALRHE
jgi:putative ABC transport system permease protein